MKTIRLEEWPYPESALKQYIRDEMNLGIAMAADPDNADLPELTIRTTTINSPWYTRTCQICKHKFREGDQVRLCPRCAEAYHDDNQYGLHCWQKKFEAGEICTPGGIDRFTEQEIPGCDFTWSGPLPDETAADGPAVEIASPRSSPPVSLVTQFVTGLEKVWSPFGQQHPEKVETGSTIVGRSCPWCRFLVRAGDWVVACPCGCGAFFHQDVFRHLTCWNEWNGVEGNDYCPITGRSYQKEDTDDRD